MWTSVGGTTPVASGLPFGRYMQWRATLATTDQAVTPVLSEVVVDYGASGAPVVTSINPARGAQGQALTITIDGTNLTGATAVDFSDTDITAANPPTIISDTRITVIINIAAGTTSGLKDISVTGPHGTGTKYNCFTVRPKFATVYVNTATGSDGNDGSSPAAGSGNIGPKQTIGGGIDAVIESGTVNVAAGTYHEHGLHLSDTMNLVGAGAPTTIIDGDASGYVLEVSSAPSQRNTISGFTIQNGAPAGSDAGGGIYISRSHIVTINDCAITNNTRDASDVLGGGGICNDGGALYMNRCTVSGNTASARGGGIFTQKIFGGFPGLVELTDCTISENSVTDSDGQGGGIWNSGTLTINRCCIGGNNADKGSGIHTMPDATATLTNCTISGNTGIGAGGGIRNWGIMSCYSVTISENRGSTGGGFSNDGAPARLYFKNCIVSGNTATGAGNNGYDTNSGAGIESGGNNIDSENSCYFNKPTDQINANPLLGPLQNNGGPTLTHAITDGSPAYNRGTSVGAPPETDQRGIIRPQAGGYDIGAFELLVSAPTIISVNPAQAFQGQTLTVTIAGTNLTGATVVNFSGSGITVGPPTVIGDTQITVNIDIAAGAAPGLRNISVTTPGGTGTLLNGFTVSAIQQFIGTGGLGGSSGSTGSTFSQTQTIVNPTFVVQGASISRAQTSGDHVTVSATVANTSTVNGITKVRLYINGQLDSERAVTVSAGSQVPVHFLISRFEPGTYQVYVNNISAGSFTVKDETVNMVVLILSLTAMLTSILGFVYMIWRRQDRGYF